MGDPLYLLLKLFSETTETWIEKSQGGCKGLKTSKTETELPQNEEILRDFFIGGCFVIKDFKNNIKVFQIGNPNHAPPIHKI